VCALSSPDPPPAVLPPLSLHDALPIFGLHLIGVPAELEGIAEERSAVTASLVLEELARGDMGIAAAIMAPAAAATAIASYGDARSEEHTSELQSRFDLVCRLLLEKKKQ